MKKLVTLFLAVALLTTLCAGAMAVTITVTNPTAGATYNAYKLMTVVKNADGTYLYTVNAKYSAILQAATGTTSDEAAILAISKIADSSAAARTLADQVYAAIRAGGLTADAANAASPITVDDNGYYLVEETTAVAGESKTISLVMLKTATEDIAITTKKSVPAVEKKVDEDDDAAGYAWQDWADYSIGDTVSFKLEGTVDQNIASYTAYKYVFHDTMAAGLTYKGMVGCYLDSVGEGNKIAAGAYTAANDGQTLTVTFADLKQVTGVKGDSRIIVVYEATLNENAVIGNNGNENNVYLEFSNNPYASGAGDNKTGETPKDYVAVFTFGMQVNKVNAAQEKLAGAKFRLYADADCTKEIKLAQDGTVYYPSAAGTAEITTPAAGTITIKGLDADEAGTTYYLKETAAPEGYNLLSAPVAVKLTATYAAGEYHNGVDEGKMLTGLTASATTGGATTNLTTSLATGLTSNFSLDVLNQSGTELPGTGGMGSTLFIAGGAALMAAAVLLLLLARRKQAR